MDNRLPKELQGVITRDHRHSVRIVEMIENVDGCYDFSDDDHDALEWALAKIGRQCGEIAHLKALRRVK